VTGKFYLANDFNQVFTVDITTLRATPVALPTGAPGIENDFGVYNNTLIWVGTGGVTTMTIGNPASLRTIPIPAKYRSGVVGAVWVTSKGNTVALMTSNGQTLRMTKVKTGTGKVSPLASGPQVDSFDGASCTAAGG
jgi:hypothetical protein